MAQNNEYDDLVSELDSSQSQQLKSADFASQGIDPEKKAESFRLSEQYKVPVEFVESNFDSFKKESSKVKDDEYDSLARDYKATSTFLSDVNNAGLAKDDVDSLKALEDVNKKSFSEGIGKSALLGLSRMNENILNIPAATYDLAAYIPNLILEKSGADYRYRSTDLPWLSSAFGTKDYYKKTSDYYSKEVPEVNSSTVELLKSGKYEDAGKALAYQVATNAPQQLFLLTATLMGRPDVGLTGIGAVATSGNIQEVVESGKDPAKFIPGAVAKGAVEVATEKLGTLSFIEKWGGSLADIAGKEGMKEVWKAFGKTIAAGVLTEGTEEVAASFASDFVDYSTGYNPVTFEQSLNNALNSLLVGGVSGGVITAPSAVMVGIQKSLEVKQAKDDAQMYEDIGNGVENSKLYKRLPKKMEEFVNSAVKDGPLEKVYISKEAFTQYFQTKNLSPSEEAAKLGISKEFNEAMETGSDIVLPMGTWVTNAVGTEHYKGLKEDVRFSADQMSEREHKAETEQLKSEMKAQVEAAKKAEDDGQEIVDEVYNMLVQAGVPKNEANKAAPLWRAIKVVAERNGRDVKQEWNKYNLKIVKSEQDPTTGSYMFDGQPQDDSPQYDMTKDENGLYKYDDIVLNNIYSSIAQGEAGGAVLPDGRRTSSTFPEFFKNKGLKKKDVLKIIDKHRSGVMLSEGQKDTLNMLYEDAIEMYKRGQFFQTKDGDTLDLYHGTKSKDQFSEFKLNDVVGTLGRGVYTSEDKDGLASIYGKNGRLIELQVKNKNKIIDSSTELSEQDINKIKESIDPTVFKILESEDDFSGNYASFFRRLQLRVNEYNSMNDASIEDQTIKAAESLDIIGLRTPGREVIVFDPKNITNKNGASFFQTKAIKQKAEFLGFDTSRVLYHGGPAKITQFKTNPKGANKYLEGVYMAYGKNDASRYADFAKKDTGDSEIYEFYPPKNLLNLDSFELVDEAIVKMGLEIPVLKKSKQYKYNPEMTNLMKMRVAVEKSGVKNKDVDAVLKNKLVDAGYSGLDTSNDQIVVVFDPNNVKSTSAEFEKLGTIYNQQAGSIQGSTSFGLNKETTITLFKQADQSTFLHESAHFFLEFFADIATSETASDQAKKDWAEILNYLGVKDRSEIETKHHEKWAETFETYLMKGEAPTPLLRKAFNTFKVWLKKVYGAAKSINGIEITPAISGVMDRMLATDEEINDAEVRLGVTNLFKDPIAAGMNEDEAAKYKEAIEGAKIYAEAQLMEKLMDELNRKQSKQYKEKFDQYRSEYYKELTQNKIYDVISILKSGKNIAGVTIENAPKINRDSVVKHFGESIAQQLPKQMYSKSKGQDIYVVADMMGYFVPDQMIPDIIESAPIDDVARQKANERIKQESPELFKEPEIKGEALMALHNNKRGELLKFEMDFLQKNYASVFKDAIRRTVRRTPLDQEVRAQAKKIVGNMSTRDLKPHLYSRAEAKASKEAGIKLAKGDIKGAFEAKRLEYLNYEIYKAVVEAQKDVEKTLKDFKKFDENTEDLSKKRDIDIINAAKAILVRYGVLKGEKDSPFDYLEKVKEYDIQTYNAIEPIIAMAMEGSGNFDSINYDKFVEMKDTVLALWDMAKNLKQMSIDGQAVEIKQAVDELSSQMDKHITDAPSAVKQQLTKSEKFKTKILGAIASLRRVESWSDLMDLGSKGPFKKYIWNPVSEAVTAYRTEEKQVVAKYKEILKKYKDLFTPQVIVADRLNGFVFHDKSQLLMAMLHTGNDSNKQKLLRGWGWGTVDENGVLDSANFDEQVQAWQADGTLTKRDYELMQEIWDLMETLKPGAQRAHKKMFGYYFNEITAKTIQTPFGDFRGGYVPAKVDSYTNEDQAIRQEREDLEKNNNSFQFPTTGRGFTKARVENYAAPLLLDMNMLMSHIDGVMRFTHVEPIVKQTARLIMNKEFRSKLSDIDSQAARETLVPWLQRTAQQKVVIPSDNGLMRALDSVAAKMRAGVAMQLMVLNFTNAAQQVTGLAVAGAKVKPSFLLAGMKEYFLNRQQLIEIANEKSPWLKSTQDQTIYESQDAIEQILTNPSTFESAQSFAKQHTYILQLATQNFVNTIVWTGAYNQAVAQGESETEAVRSADSAVRLTQGTNNAEDISRFEVGSATYRLFTQFAGYFNMLSNLQAGEFQKLSRTVGLKKGAGRAFYLYMATMMVPAVVAQLIVKGMKGDDFDEDEDGIANDLMALFFGSQFKTLTAQVPFVGTVATAAYNRFNKQQYDDRLSFSPVISVLEAGAGVPYLLYNDATKEELKKRTVKDFLNTVGVITSLPTGPLGRPIGYLMDVNEGDANPTGPVDFTRGLISGQKGE